MAVAAVDDDVTRLEDRQELLDEVIDSLTGLDQKQDLSGSLEVVGKFLDAVASDDVLAFGPSVGEVVHLLHGAVVDCDGEALGLHVHDKVLAHDGKSD